MHVGLPILCVRVCECMYTFDPPTCLVSVLWLDEGRWWCVESWGSEGARHEETASVTAWSTDPNFQPLQQLEERERGTLNHCQIFNVLSLFSFLELAEFTSQLNTSKKSQKLVFHVLLNDIVFRHLDKGKKNSRWYLLSIQVLFVSVIQPRLSSPSPLKWATVQHSRQ